MLIGTIRFHECIYSQPSFVYSIKYCLNMPNTKLSIRRGTLRNFNPSCFVGAWINLRRLVATPFNQDQLQTSFSSDLVTSYQHVL